ncbi:uncharacterized protein [Mycetomoellerius zeteki]|uniref:uncharacterized protein n=1 Tax=Mycetomoellerius zeteki TaxID=64791 RepID=UPI00084EBAEC|nr:PREDICTED: uncharacterized protein LOC108731518 [Trachymyrmex zeteki]XP_018317374.1 PREDICTED: uncharacterized protein LOC108731518 [Trachymyrmex zeteki]XP_018317375.1 PREDICTED: uncharacterized protein LOC108731518 [Trachymyrmex zeteki]XP_018317376.1 PREDICTED: uncharacterized protein LOC108731518 [Trachymyrmex zeteki]
MKTYVPSGSGALSSNLKNFYRYFELMKPLDDTLQAESTISTLSIESQPSTSDENTSGYLSTVESIISPNFENSVGSNDIAIFQSPTPLLNRPSRTPTPNSKQTLKSENYQKMINHPHRITFIEHLKYARSTDGCSRWIS